MMVKILGLELFSDYDYIDRVADFFLDDLKAGLFLVYAINSVDEKILLAELHLLHEGISYNSFEKRIDLLFQGRLMTKGCPTCYLLRGNKLTITGHCSVINNVCGADLLMNKSSFQWQGQLIRQKYTVDMKKVVKLISA